MSEIKERTVTAYICPEIIIAVCKDHGLPGRLHNDKRGGFGGGTKHTIHITCTEEQLENARWEWYQRMLIE